jgi:hypothetical protein
MRVLDRGIAEQVLEGLGIDREQAGEWSIGGLLPPFAQQMKRNEQRRLERAGGGGACGTALDQVDQQRRDLDPALACGQDRGFGQALVLGQMGEDGLRFVAGPGCRAAPKVAGRRRVG